MCDRIVVLIDMDCFYCQVEMRLDPSLIGKPMAVVQYNQWKGGGIIAVNYEARKFGVTRHLRGNEAKQKCQDIVLIHVPAVRGKADLTKYREAGREVVNVLCQFSDCVERASVDEAYIDITNRVEERLKAGTGVTASKLPHTFVVGLSDNDSNDEDNRRQSVESWLGYIDEMKDSVQLKLAIGAVLVEEMRAAVFSQTGFECSAGIAHNKILSKLACGLHKPNRQTVLPQSGVSILYQTLPIKKIRSLGGKFGDMVVDNLGCTVMADLAKFSEKQLQQKFDEKAGTWLYNIAQGIDNDRVTQRLITKSIGCCKKFPGKQALGMKKDIEKWLHELAAEVSERLLKDLQENKRRASLLTVSYSQDIDGRPVSSSRSGALPSYEPQKIVDEALELLKKSNTTPGTLQWNPPLKYLGISVGKFSSLVQAPKIDKFFTNVMKKNDVNEKPKLNCSITADARSETSGKNINSQETAEKSLGVVSSEVILSSSVSENAKQCNIHATNALQCTNDCQGKSTKISSHNPSKLSHLSGTVTKNKMKLLENVPSNSMGRSFFINYLRTRQPGQSSTASDNLLITKNNVGNSHHLLTTSHSEAISRAGVDQISSAHGPGKNIKSEVSQCISVSEIFPDLSQADSDVVELLPTQMRKQVKARKLAKQTETESNERESLPGMCGSDSVSSCSDDSLMSENKNCVTNVVVDVHKNLSLDKVCASSSVNATRSVEDENSISSVNNCLLSSLQKDEAQSFNNHRQVRRLSEIELPFKDISSGKNNADDTEFASNLDKPVCSIVIDGDHEKCLDSENALKNNESIVTVGVENKLVCSSEVEILQDNDDNEGRDNYDTLQELCSQCRKLVPLKDFPEHIDYHVAENLQKELNSERAQHPHPVPCKSPMKQNVGKRKRGKPSKKQGAVAGIDKKMRSITTFFAPR